MCRACFEQSSVNVGNWSQKIRPHHTYDAGTSLATSPAKIRFKTAVLVFKCLHGLAPEYLSEYCKMTTGRSHLRLFNTPCPIFIYFISFLLFISVNLPTIVEIQVE